MKPAARLAIRRVVISALAAGLLSVAAVAQDLTLERAGQALNAGDFPAALALLEPLETNFAGDPAYDYLLGLALLENGQPGRAIFALERTLAVQPDNAAARMEIARAYYALGQLDEAEAEFVSLRGFNPPPAAQSAITEYLDLIASRRDRGKLVRQFGVGLRAGYDTNANSATTLPSFLGFDLLPTSRESDSLFTEYAGNARLAKPLRGGLLLDTQFDLSHRANPDAGFVDATTVRGAAGVRHVREGRTVALTLSAYRLNVDGDLNSEGVSLNAAWDKAVARDWRVGVFGRAGVVRFDQTQNVRDVDQLLLGASVNRTLGSQRQGSVSATLLAGRDDASRAGSRYSRDVYGLRVGAGWALGPRVRLTASASGLVADYDEVFFEQLFDAPRKDTLGQAVIGLEWRISRHWMFRHLIAYTRNVTDVEIFEYDRLQVSVGIDRLWR